MVDFDSRFQHDSTFRALALLFAFAAALAPAEVCAQASDRHDMPGMGSTEPTTSPSGTGTVTAVNTTSRKVTLDHGPVAALNWPAMKMEFTTAPSVDLTKVKVGDKVKFTLSRSGGAYTIQSISPSP